MTGLASHSALNHLGVNAIEIGAAIITELRRLNDEFRAAGPFADGFEPPHCTVSTGVIAGGSALNIVPDHCRFEFEFRPLPGQDPDALFARIRDWAERTLLPTMRELSPAAGIAWQELMSYPALGGAASRHRGGVLPPDRNPGANQAGVRDRGRHSRQHGSRPRPRRHQGGAQARRVRRAGSAGALHPVSARAGARHGDGLTDGRPRRRDRRRGSAHRRGNSDTSGVTSFDSGQPGPHVAITARVHGNELRGAWALLRLLAGASGRRGRLSLAFVNLAAFDAFDPGDPRASRYLDEDLNRVWSPATLDGPRRCTSSTARAAAADRERRFPARHPFDAVGSATLLLTGVTDKGRRLAGAMGFPACIVADAGHRNGARILDFGARRPRRPRTAVLVECGQHWAERSVRGGERRLPPVSRGPGGGGAPAARPSGPPARARPSVWWR